MENVMSEEKNNPSEKPESPSQNKKMSESPSKNKKMSESPSKDKKMSESPSKEKNISESPSKDKKISESPKKDKKKKEFSSFPLFDKKLCQQYFKNASTISSLGEDQQTQDEVAAKRKTDEYQTINQDSSSTLKCSYCQVSFEEIIEHRNHYKQDWHRYNLKRSLENKPSVLESEFNTLIEGKDADTLSISGSDSESDEDEDEIGFLKLQRNPKFFFRTTGGEVLSVYKTILVDPKNKYTQPSDEALLASIGNEECKWAIFMVGGGHFAAAVFHGESTVVHKTFHSYTVRKKQGGSQGAADNRAGANHKSAGASLRRYNELAHIQHIQDITKQWEKELASCSLIFVRASSHSRSTLFSGKTPALNRSDSRLRTVPFPTKRATFSEVKRAHEALSKVDVLQNIPIDNLNVKPKKTVGGPTIHRSKSRESKQRVIPGTQPQLDDENLKDFEARVNAMLVSENEELQEISKKKKGKNKNKVKAGGNYQDITTADNQNIDEEARFSNEIENQCLTAVRTGNVKLFNQTIQLLEDEFSDKELEKELQTFLNKTLGDQRLTYLHFASQAGHRPVISKLLELGADPTIKDKTGRVAFTVAKEKETRGVFIKFRSLNEERYDWKKASVPEPLSDEQLQQKNDKEREKKKAKQQEKKERMKIRKEQDKQIKAETEEKDRYLALTDREKRALAAERRILADNTAVVLNRCFQCGLDITGKVPFAYSDNNFCTINCVKRHRATLE